MNLRRMIIEHVRRSAHRKGRGSWVLDAYCELLKNGADPENAAAEMTRFVDDIIEQKKKNERTSVGT